MVALRVSLLYLGMVWYDNIKDDIRDDIYQRSIKYVHIPTGLYFKEPGNLKIFLTGYARI